MNDIIAIKNIPENVAAAMEDITEYKCRLHHITVGHIHPWDGGYLCGNGYTASYEDYCADLEDMMRIFYDIACSFGMNETEVYPFDNCFFEHWQDVMDNDIARDIYSAFGENEIDPESGCGIRLNVYNDLTKLLISGAFNYLIKCAFLIGEAVIIPTHNFEFYMYPCSEQSREKIRESISRCSFVKFHEEGC
ncbi:MAG: hypothetical protein K2K57_03265 [Oscillospiraceae bacterium]|nr:hypothetical protein [Oscillospiraceae bacterium]